MFSAIGEILQMVRVYIRTNYILSVGWFVSFFVHRFIARGPGESYKQSGLMAVGVASVAAIDYALRDTEYVDTYAVTYATMAASKVYPVAKLCLSNRIDVSADLVIGPLLEIVSSSGAVMVSAFVGSSVWATVHYGYVPQAIGPVATGFSSAKMHGERAAVASSALSVADEVMIYNNITDKHYLSFLALSHGIAECFASGNIYVHSALALGGALTAHYEAEIFEAFLPINSTKETYNLLLEISGGDTKTVNRILETNLVVAGNIELSYGLLFMDALQMANEWIGLFGDACKNPARNSQKFIEFAKKSMLFDFQIVVMHGLPLIPLEDCALLSTKRYFKQKLLNNTIYDESKFILISKSDNTAEIYLKDVSTIIDTHWSIYQGTMKSIPSLMVLTSFGKKVLIIPVVAGVDYFITLGLNYLQEKLRELRENQGMAGSKIGIIEKHDREYASVLVQTGAMHHMKKQWQNFIDHLDDLSLNGELVSDIYSSGQRLYWDICLWSGVPILMVKLAAIGVVAPGNVVTAIVSTKHSLGTILMKSKNVQQLNNADISIKRLNGLFDSIESQRNTAENITISFTDDNILQVENLVYVRGNTQGSISISVPSISFVMGKNYVITGGNGSGKSSFLLLIDLLLRKVNDDSFLSVNGSISYPVEKFSIVTQKEYCPVAEDMFSWLVYPKDASKFSEEQKQQHQVKIVWLLEELKFSPKNLTAVAEEFYTVKNNWCGDLSGGQIKKMQLMQQVFVPDKCPEVLLMDEVMGPLDPESKKIVHQMIMDHCKDSLILSVHHYDSNVLCVPTDSMYEYNIHFENSTAIQRPLCGESDVKIV